MTGTRVLVVSIVVISCSILVAQERGAGVAVELDQRPVLTLHAGVGSFTASGRAAAVTQRLRELARVGIRGTSSATVQNSDVGLLVLVGGTPVVSVTDADARAEGASADTLAQQWAAAITTALTQAQSQNASRTFVRRLLITAAVLVSALAFLWLLPRERRKVRRRAAAVAAKVPAVRFRGVELVAAERIARLIEELTSLAFTAIGLVVLAVAFLLVFDQFPTTQGYARVAFQWIWQPLVDIFWGTVRYLPNLFYIIVIIAVTRALMRAISLVFAQAARGAISLEPWGTQRCCAADESDRQDHRCGDRALLHRAPDSRHR